MEMTLLLNSTYEPLRVVHWQKAIALLWQGKVEVLEVYDREVHGVSISFKLPAVMRLLKLVRLKDSHRAVKFSRINIFTRDGYVCQYCRTKFRTEELTFDHVVPIAKGGRKTWENIVTACWRCNNRKSGRTPDEAGMRRMKRTQSVAATRVMMALAKKVKGKVICTCHKLMGPVLSLKFFRQSGGG